MEKNTQSLPLLESTDLWRTALRIIALICLGQKMDHSYGILA